MPLTQTQLLCRLCRELDRARRVLLLGPGEAALRAAGGEPQPWRRWSHQDESTPPDAAVVTAACVSIRGDVVLDASASAAAESLPHAQALLADAGTVLALITSPPDRDARAAARSAGSWLADHALGVFAAGVVDRIVTPWALLAVTPEGPVIRELAPDVSCSQLQAAVDVTLKIRSDVAEMSCAMLERSEP